MYVLKEHKTGVDCLGSSIVTRRAESSEVVLPPFAKTVFVLARQYSEAVSEIREDLA